MDIEQQHYTLRQLAKMWGLGYSTVHRMFQTEPGVVKMRAKLPPRNPNRKANYVWRIPREVAERVYARQRVGGAPRL